jgi:hypothetical protein
MTHFVSVGPSVVEYVVLNLSVMLIEFVVLVIQDIE